MFRLRHLALACLALLCLFVIVAGIAVVRMLPPRLAQWDVPRVGARPAAAASAPLRAAAGTPDGTASGVTRAGLSRVLGPLASSSLLGSHVGVLVTSLHSGRVLYSRDASGAFAPASTTKVATAVAALEVLGPAARFRTRVVAGRSPGSIVLVGGGDPTLAAGRPPAADYPRDATLAALAARTARALRHAGRHRVTLGYDTSLYTGPGMAPGWTMSYVTTGNVTPVSPLEVDQGRLTPGGAPQDADDPQNGRPRTMTPAPQAAAAFAAFLAADGIRVTGAPAAATAPARARSLAVVASPPLAQMARQMLQESNNVIAENLARHVAIANGRPASFSGAAAAEESVLRRLGVTGVHLVDGSGLSPRDRITPQALVALVRLAASADRPRLREAITGLPVAGFSGTLAPGGSVFAEAGPAALGVVRAKTGNLNTVAALAGIAYARNGQLLAFAFMADKFPARGLNQAGTQIARLATALAACGCR
ncbi:MAG TPA: D-alanyl-D-alanine carboxypeptidase/D-alanyl-D-alanine-endopeptidase [Streptosporangiaceae bacterium]|nr:D-alanyl-D-alanine carboxypeptidase/D-alanyl-D-alanine-endopeptidase [Streptosporangiaceae bacterium]